MKTKSITTSLIALVLLTGSVGAQAAETSISSRVASGIGHVIAEQGNKAFREMREEARKQLVEAIKPLLPKPAAAAELPALVQMHEEARRQQ